MSTNPNINLGSAAWEVQKAVIQKLLSTVELTSMAGVFDYVPDNTPYPLVAFGEMTEDDKFNTMQARGRQLYYTLHVWSRKPGFSEVHRIANFVVGALENTDLGAMGVWNWVLTQYIQAHTVHDPDGITQHGILRFRTCVSQAS